MNRLLPRAKRRQPIEHRPPEKASFPAAGVFYARGRLTAGRRKKRISRLCKIEHFYLRKTAVYDMIQHVNGLLFRGKGPRSCNRIKGSKWRGISALRGVVITALCPGPRVLTETFIVVFGHGKGLFCVSRNLM